MPEEPVVVDKTEARQADARRMNLRVLVIATVIVVAGFALLYLLYFQPDTTL
jgi:hypothetical protein